jgi:hypothetical protein
MHLTPVLVARAQLLTALDLFVADKDAVSVQALAGNAREILESLCRLAGIEPLTELLLRQNKGKPARDLYKAMNLYRNCFKHLGETERQRADDQLTLDQFDDTKNEYLLYVCVEDYLRLRKTSPVPFQVFQTWFCAMHVDLLAPSLDRKVLESIFPTLQTLDRVAQKRVLAITIERYSGDAGLLADAQTEPLHIER